MRAVLAVSRHLDPRLLLVIGLVSAGYDRAVAQDSTAADPRYQASAAMLTRFIAHEMADKKIPAVSIALVDDQRVVWARGFGFANPADSTRATAETIYRVGPLSELLTDIAVMQQIESGKMALDAPVARYLPDFKPANSFARPITLRELMAHRAGLVREPPVGNYFDSVPATLAATVTSLNRTAVAYTPGSSEKYSNAGAAVAGYAVERESGTPWADYVRQRILLPLGMQHSDFTSPEGTDRELAKGFMWTVDGRRFDAPAFPLGMVPAGGLYSTVNDISLFIRALFAGGKTAHGRILQSSSLERMGVLQSGAWCAHCPTEGFGLGSYVSRLDHHPRVRHAGGIYGFTTELETLPDDKLGVVVIANLDAADAVTRRVAEAALRAMLAARGGKPVLEAETTSPVAPAVVARMRGHFVRGTRTIELREREGTLMLVPSGGVPVAVRARGDTLVVDDAREFGTVLVPLDSDRIGFGSSTDVFQRHTILKPPAPQERRQGLIGEYGWDYNSLYVYESEGGLHALINWFFSYGLQEVSDSVFHFPPLGLFGRENLVFHRDARGRALDARLSGVVFLRRSIGPEDGNQLKVPPVRPVPDLLREALTATPPPQAAGLRAPDLVELNSLDSTIHYEIRYASTNNFAGTVFYPSVHAFMQRPAAEAVVRASQSLRRQGYGLLIHDAYRPWYVTKTFWDAMPGAQRWMVANPYPGSKHNRGCAVDLTLYDLRTGRPVEMTGTYDEATDRSLSDYPGGTSLQRWHRELLRTAMEAQGFAVNPTEWWHFDYQDWRQYPVLNLTFDQLSSGH